MLSRRARSSALLSVVGGPAPAPAPVAEDDDEEGEGEKGYVGKSLPEGECRWWNTAVVSAAWVYVKGNVFVCV